MNKLEQMFEVLRSRPKKRLAAAYANDDHTICAVSASHTLAITSLSPHKIPSINPLSIAALTAHIV